MTHSKQTSAAGWTEHFSGWLSSLIPGGFRLPVRHPIKVSLLMGLLGWCSGWLTVLPFAAAQVLLQTQTAAAPGVFFVVFGIAFAMPGAAILWPISLLLGRRGSLWLLASVAASVMIHFCGLMILILMNQVFFPQSGADDLRVLAPGMACLSLGYVMWVSWMSRTWSPTQWAATLVLCTLVGVQSMRWQTDFSTLLVANLKLSQDSASLLTSCWGYASFQAVLAICLGSVAWDRTPAPKFEPHQKIS